MCAPAPSGACVPHTAILSKLNHFRLMGECTNGSHTIFEVEHLSVAIICGIHLLQSRIRIQHGLSCFHTVILYQFASDANPLATFKCTQFCFRIGMQLLGNILLLASLDVQLAFKNMCRAKRTHSRLVAFDRCQVICFSFFFILSFPTQSCVIYSFISAFPKSRPHSSRLPAASSAQPSLLLHEPSDQRRLSWPPVYLIPFQLFPYTLESISFKEKSLLFLHTIRNLCGDLILCGLNLYDRIIISKSSCCDNEVPEFPSI